MRRLLALCWVCSAASVHAQVTAPLDAGNNLSDVSAQMGSAVERLAQKSRDEATALMASKNYAGALKALERAHELDARNVDTTVQLAELQELLGRSERAETLYRELIALDPERGSAYVALGDLLARDVRAPERLKEAADLLSRARELLVDDESLILRQARLAATRGLTEDAERAYQSYLAAARADDALRIELGDFYRDVGRPEDAARFYREVGNGERARVAAQRLFELEVDREAKRYGLSRRDTASDAQARALAAKARVQNGQGQRARAEALLRDALRLGPGLPSVHADLADVLHEAGRDAEAELEYLRSIALDGSQPDVSLRLSQLYLAGDESKAPYAALLAERALQLRPDWTEPQLILARAHRAQGDLPRALMRVQRFLAQAQPGAARDEALALQASLEALLGTASALDPNAEDAALPTDPLARARVFIARGRSDAALAELQRLNRRAPSVEALNMQAQLLQATGRLDEAAEVLKRSLDKRAQQPDMHAALAEMLLLTSHPKQARGHWLECERMGNARCSFRLAQLDAGEDHGVLGVFTDAGQWASLLHARERLSGLRADRASQLSQTQIDTLATRVTSRLLALATAAGLCLASCMGLWLVLRRARSGGIGISSLLDRHPDTGPDVQRVLSALRHEVLKHNTLMLRGLIESVRDGAPVREPASHILRAFFGEDGRAGVEPRLHAYAQQLVSLARAHGERLNLTHRDPLLAALSSGFSRMRELRSALMASDTPSPAKREQLVRKLEIIDELLNQRGQAELRALLDRVRLLQVDAALITKIFDRVRHEPALAAADIASLVIDPVSRLPCELSIPQQAFDDILSNLFRNALQASLKHEAARPVVVGFSVQLETDAVTAIERVVMRVQDRAPQRLDRARLRDAYIEAGLGLTADLVARHEGQLDVSEDEPGFQKAVVLRLPGQSSEDA